MKKLMIIVALGEAGPGLALLTVPSLVGQLLFGQEVTGVAIALARVIGITLIALGVGCWPGPALVGILTYSTVVALYLAYLGFAGGLTGILLWPAVGLHVVLSALLTYYANALRLHRSPDDTVRLSRRCATGLLALLPLKGHGK
jgi:hypothetical protein